MSDGSDTPETVVELAHEAGCAALALTDHDTVAGIPEAAGRARALGLTFVPGCELTCLPIGRGGVHVERTALPLRERPAERHVEAGLVRLGVAQ